MCMQIAFLPLKWRSNFHIPSTHEKNKSKQCEKGSNEYEGTIKHIEQ